LISEENNILFKEAEQKRQSLLKMEQRRDSLTGALLPESVN
jgi:hypothetical protein